MKRRVLRGHHLLCVHGFQGMGYSPSFVTKMQEVVDEIRDDTLDYPIQVVIGLDETCAVCPHKGEGYCDKSTESDQHVRELDKRVTEHLCIQHGDVYNKSELVSRVAQFVNANDLDYLCEGCSWLEFGVCKAGVIKLKHKHQQI